MTAINHALTGAALGLLVGEPLIAIPCALASHFVCDALPHFGSDKDEKQWLASKAFRNILSIDAVACIALVSTLAIAQPTHWLLASVCAFMATSPDFFWIPKFLAAKRGSKEWSNAYTRFAKGIQWFQRPIGAVVEVVWFAGFMAIVSQFL